jgi:hypothetical protein
LFSKSDSTSISQKKLSKTPFKMLFKSYLVLAFVSVTAAIPVRVGVEFEKRSGLPQLNLPYGIWQAKSYNALSDM